MNENIELQSQSNNPSLTTPSALAEVTLAWASATPLSSTETSSTLKFAPRNYPHTPEQIAKELRVDEEGVLWWKKQGQSNQARRKLKQPVGSLSGRKLNYLSFTVHGYRYLVHTVVFCLYHGRWPLPGKVIDHINHNTLNNRKENLREVSNTENQRNRKGLQSNNKSGIAGVGWAKDRNKWYADLTLNGKTIHGGSHESFEDAVAARQQLEIDYGIADYAVMTVYTSPKSKTIDAISTFQQVKL